MKLLPDSKFPNKGLTCLSNFSNQQPITIASVYLPISLSNLLLLKTLISKILNVLSSAFGKVT